jgi:hypothetical protein
MLRWIFLLTFFFNFGWASETLQEGISLFQAKEYEKALIAFQKSKASEDQQLGCLVGELFCNVALGNLSQIDPSMQLLTQKLQEFTNCDKPPKDVPITQETQQMAYQCRRHIREIANQMRQTVEKLVRETVTGVLQKIQVLRKLYPFIDALEQVGIDCCQSNFPWACCMDPLLEQLESWRTLGLQQRHS